jgi:DNA-directed RNA polymerase specialized sigma24 family protein
VSLRKFGYSKENNAERINKQGFDIEFTGLMGASQQSTLMAFTRRLLIQFHLDQLYSENDVLNEVYLRGVKQIESGTEIKLPSAWIKRTAFNVIRELSRTQKRYESAELDQLPALEQPSALTLDFPDESDVRQLLASFKTLSKSDQEILQLRLINNLSWQEVSQRLEARTGTLQDIQSLRKRGERALRRLRKEYLTRLNQQPEQHQI